jgi:peptidyl-prolyl cis-trans isomerase A (cyclophilin A)
MRYFDENRFFRVVPGFVAQFGVHKDYDIHDRWRKYFILDDPPKEKNLRGTLAFAQSDPNTRATEIFINLADNAALDAQNFVPFAKVVSGMDVVDKFYSGYGELMPEGKYIDPNRVENGTNAYLEPHFPKLDYIRRAVFQSRENVEMQGSIRRVTLYETAGRIRIPGALRTRLICWS